MPQKGNYYITFQKAKAAQACKGLADFRKRSCPCGQGT